MLATLNRINLFSKRVFLLVEADASRYPAENACSPIGRCPSCIISPNGMLHAVSVKHRLPCHNGNEAACRT